MDARASNYPELRRVFFDTPAINPGPESITTYKELLAMEDSIRRALGYPVLYPSSPVPKVHMYVDMAEQKELAKATNVPFNLINPVKVVAYMIDGASYVDLPNLHFDACKNALREAQSHSRTTNRTVRFTTINLRYRREVFYLWEIMPSNKRVITRLGKLYKSTKHGD